MKVSQLIEHLKTLPQDRIIFCQVVGNSSGAWNMAFEFNPIDRADIVQLRVWHPTLDELPMSDELFEEKEHVVQ